MIAVGGLEDDDNKVEDLEEDDDDVEDPKDASGNVKGLEDYHDKVEALMMTGRRMRSCTSRYSSTSDSPSFIQFQP